MRGSANASRDKTHNYRDECDGKAYGKRRRDVFSPAITDMGQLILGLPNGQAMIDSPVDLLRSHVRTRQEFGPLACHNINPKNVERMQRVKLKR